jgi:DNA repair ATPase RecN
MAGRSIKITAEMMADAKKLENAISEKQELDAKVQTLSTKLKYTEEALTELKQKVPNDVANEIEALLMKKLKTAEMEMSNSSFTSPTVGNTSIGAPPAPPPPPPVIFFK